MSHSFPLADPEKRKRIIPIAIILLLAIGGYYLYANGMLPFFSNPVANTASGFIEGEEISISAEVGGRIESVTAQEGDVVKQGQELVRLDRSMLDAQIAQAQAALNTANAQLAQIKAGSRAEDVRQAEAALAQALAARDGAKKAWENAQAVRASPQELDARIAASEAQYKSAKYNYDAARANAVAARSRVDAIGGVDQIRVEGKVIVEQWAVAEATVQSVEAQLAGAYKGLQILLDMRARPIAMDTQVDAAKAQYDASVAAAGVAQARYDAVKAGATKEQVAIAEASVKQAEAALKVLEVQAAKMILKSPVNGIVSRRALHTGELATPNATVLSVTDLGTVKLTIYVPETQIGQIKVGDEFPVGVDSFPGKTFKGKVVFINTTAEFTPRNVQTKSERVNTVFAVKLQIANPNAELKPGMPADATLK
jgi:HlyD family secretion protein